MEQNTRMNESITRYYTWCAGLLDSATGMGLITIPAFTLQMMGMDPAAYQLGLIRFIGIFVFSVGSLYLWGLFFQSRQGTSSLKSVWLVTIWIRLCVGSILLGMILSHTLSTSWGLVSLTDLSLAAFQIWWLKRNRFSIR
jgi:hypothetical protein